MGDLTFSDLEEAMNEVFKVCDSSRPEYIIVSLRTAKAMRRIIYGHRRAYSRRQGPRGRKASLNALRRSRSLLDVVAR